VAGGLGGKIGVAPRLFLKKLVADILDRVDLHEDFDPRRHYTLTLAESEMSVVERAAASATSVTSTTSELGGTARRAKGAG
jgi:hypothetical protein